MSCDSAPSILYHNNRDGTFTDVGTLSGVAYNVDGREQAWAPRLQITMAMGIWIFFARIFPNDTPTLYHDNGDGTFTDVTYPAGLGSSTRYLADDSWGLGLHSVFPFDRVYFLRRRTYEALLIRPPLIALRASPEAKAPFLPIDSSEIHRRSIVGELLAGLTYQR